MITDDKKEEVRDAADIVEVVGDYVKLKRSGSGFTGLCPYHDEKTPSFNVTPRLGIYKCFGCGESGDVFKFVMDQDGIGFTEAVRQLADRYGVFIPEEESNEPSESLQQKEGIYHALKFAGIYFYRNLIENPDAEKALKYLDNRGYNREVFKKYGLGYAPTGGSDLYKAAQNAGISEEYLVEADLIKPSQRGEGYYDTFRGRLMFPIFGTTGKVIAFAGRVLGNEKTAKYINSAQTKVYNKSEVVYGVNFAKNEIRKNKEVILVEGYTDVITLNEHGIKNVVASSGTALTPGQIKILKRYGDTLVMIYDSDAAGQNAMMRGIDIALSQGMNVKILELPDGEDPDSFVKQFGKESFEKQKREQTLGFIDFLVSRLILEGKAEDPEQRNELINRILESIAHIPLKEDQPVYVQALHEYTSKYTGKSDRDLFTRLDRIINKKRNEKNYNAFDEKEQKNDLKESKVEKKRDVISYGKKKQDEKELIRLMITYGRDMVEYICSFTNEKLFEDDELKTFYSDILGRYKEEKEISIQVYSGKQEPFPRLVGDVLLEQYAPSERHQEKVGLKYEKDKNPYRTAKSTMKAMELAFFKRKLAELSERFGRSDSQDEKKKIMTSQTKIQEKVTKLTTTYSDDHYPDPPQESDNVVNESKFEYKMKGDRN
ncbi:MAG: DNA primase [Bacteroidetes bacterium]|nr:DNA primase [Bacteroidota bacterium]|tara:strand:- start:8156 stop:10129 length:1974 start_codon:yes stop_codon:yes gene_type:complete